MVAPSSIAVSRSPLIPIESSWGSTLGRLRAIMSCWMRLRSWKQARTFSVSALNKPIVISPLIWRVGRAATCFTRSSTSEGSAPNLLSSLEVFTWIKMSSSLPSLARRLWSFWAKSRRSTDSTQLTS